MNNLFLITLILTALPYDDDFARAMTDGDLTLVYTPHAM
jgi:hypothetical protein